MKRFLNSKFITYSYLLILLLAAILPLNSISKALNDNYTLHIRWDYLLHALVYSPLPVLLSKNRFSIRMALLSLFIAALLEALQLLIPYRAFNINDLIANCVGIGIGLLLIPVFRKFIERITWIDSQ